MKIIDFKEIDSTNEYCKRVDDGEDLIVTADRQTHGKGTKGRSFVSDDGGLYVTVMRHYSDFSSAEAFKIMINACVAICRTVEHFGLKPVIRWANDVLAGGKKICGTLIENTFSGGNISRSIVGIGLNINNSLPNELSDIATTMGEVLCKSLSIEEVKNVLIKNLQNSYTIDDYKNYINWLGCKVTLKTSNSENIVIAKDIDSCGRLICNVGGKLESISSAEVSLRL